MLFSSGFQIVIKDLKDLSHLIKILCLYYRLHIHVSVEKGLCEIENSEGK